MSFRNKKKIVQENPKAQEFNKPGTRNLELPDVPTFNREINKNLPFYLKANLEIEKYCCNMAVSHDDSSPKKSQCTIWFVAVAFPSQPTPTKSEAGGSGPNKKHSILCEYVNNYPPFVNMIKYGSQSQPAQMVEIIERKELEMVLSKSQTRRSPTTPPRSFCQIRNPRLRYILRTNWTGK